MAAPRKCTNVNEIVNSFIYVQLILNENHINYAKFPHSEVLRFLGALERGGGTISCRIKKTVMSHVTVARKMFQSPVDMSINGHVACH